MTRYKRLETDHPRLMARFGDYNVVAADCVDTRTSTTYTDGAWWVEGPNVERRKKGAIGRPYFGESAWMDAERLAGDLATADRFNR